MTTIENLQDKIDQLKNNEETLYVGTKFESQLNEKIKDLETLESEIDKELQQK